MRAPNIALFLFSLSCSAPAALVTGQSVFNSSPAGIFADWTHTFTAGDPGITITSVKIVLNSNLFFDPTGAAPGFLANQNFGTIAGGGTGFTGAYTPGTDGSTTVTMNFTSFGPGQSYSHTGDVDENVTLQNCGGLGGGALVACLAANVAATTDGSLVSGAEMAGSTVEITLGGLAVPTTLTGIFVATGASTASATWTGDVALVPEPATLLLCAGALLALGFRRRR